MVVPGVRAAAGKAVSSHAVVPGVRAAAATGKAGKAVSSQSLGLRILALALVDCKWLRLRRRCESRFFRVSRQRAYALLAQHIASLALS